MRVAAVTPSDVTHDREPEARARRIDIEAPEALKHGFLLAGRNAGAFVGHFDHYRSGAALRGGDPRAHLPAAMQYRILEQIAHHVAQVIAIAADLNRVGHVDVELTAGGLHQRQRRRGCFAHHARQIDDGKVLGVPLARERLLAGEIEELIDEASHLRELPLDRAPVGIAGEFRALQSQVEDRERGAQLMRRIRGSGDQMLQPLAIAIIAGALVQLPLVLLAMPVVLGLTLRRAAAAPS